MKLGKICKWEDLEIGEVFACDGCLTIAEKSSENTAFILATTFELKDYNEDIFSFDTNDTKFSNLIGREFKRFDRSLDNSFCWGVEYKDLINRNKCYLFFSTKTRNRELLFKLSKQTQELWKTTRKKQK